MKSPLPPSHSGQAATTLADAVVGKYLPSSPKKEVTPARIEFEQDGESYRIDFHASMSEGHQASNSVTSFPVAEGFDVSAYSITHNAKVELQGIISDVVMSEAGAKLSSEEWSASAEGGKQIHVSSPERLDPSGNNNKLLGTDGLTYGRHNSKIVFKTLKSLVEANKVCKVVTNLYIYENVVFTEFQTTQDTKSGVDVMRFQMKGENLRFRRGDSLPSTTVVVFTQNTDANVIASPGARTAELWYGDDWDFSEVDADDDAFASLEKELTKKKMVHECKSYNPINDSYEYVTNVKLPPTVEQKKERMFPPAVVTAAGSVKETAKEVGTLAQGCAKDAILSTAKQEIGSAVSETVLGMLPESLYGHKLGSGLFAEGSAGDKVAQATSKCVATALAKNTPVQDVVRDDFSKSSISKMTKNYSNLMFDKNTGKGTIPRRPVILDENGN